MMKSPDDISIQHVCETYHIIFNIRNCNVYNVSEISNMTIDFIYLYIIIIILNRIYYYHFKYLRNLESPV